MVWFNFVSKYFCLCFQDCSSPNCFACFCVKWFGFAHIWLKITYKHLIAEFFSLVRWFRSVDPSQVGVIEHSFSKITHTPSGCSAAVSPTHLNMYCCDIVRKQTRSNTEMCLHISLSESLSLCVLVCLSVRSLNFCLFGKSEFSTMTKEPEPRRSFNFANFSAKQDTPETYPTHHCTTHLYLVMSVVVARL